VMIAKTASCSRGSRRIKPKQKKLNKFNNKYLVSNGKTYRRDSMVNCSKLKGSSHKQ
jgi:hypothetical protein